MPKISLHDLRVETIIGAYTEERHQPQPVRGFIELSGDWQKANGVFDYATLEYAACYALEHGGFEYLEDAAEALLDIVQSMATHLDGVDGLEFTARVQLFKPKALVRSFPSVECTRVFRGSERLAFAAWGRMILSIIDENTAPTVELTPEKSLRLYLNQSSESPVVDGTEVSEPLLMRTLSLSTNIY